jgi:hypothetical protein
MHLKKYSFLEELFFSGLSIALHVVLETLAHLNM